MGSKWRFGSILTGFGEDLERAWEDFGEVWEGFSPMHRLLFLHASSLGFAATKTRKNNNKYGTIQMAWIDSAKKTPPEGLMLPAVNYDGA